MGSGVTCTVEAPETLPRWYCLEVPLTRDDKEYSLMTFPIPKDVSRKERERST